MTSRTNRFRTGLILWSLLAVFAGTIGCGGDVPPNDLGEENDIVDVLPQVDTAQGTTCKEYCAVVMEACTGDNQLYEDNFECRAYCQSIGVWEGGDGDDFDQNNIGCRKIYAEMALEGNAEQHCRSASPLGGNVCGSWCDNYCNLMMRHCVAESEVYSTEDECHAACAEFVDFGAVSENPNNTLQCRLSYLEKIPFTPETHCSSAGPSGTPDCVPTEACTAYCETVESNCTGYLQQYENRETCMDTCISSEFWAPGSPGETNANSRECRMEQAALTSGSNKEVHCLAAGPSGGDICGSWCAVMCHLEDINCTEENSVYDSVSECIESCSTFQIGAPTDPPNSNTVQCRIDYLGAPAMGDPAANCGAAGPEGGGLCSEAQSNQCALYCGKVTEHCTGEHSQYSSHDDCMMMCIGAAQWPAGGALDLSGNTLGCRSHRAELAQHSPAEHCAAAGPTGGGQCGAWCEVLCDLHQKNCMGENQVYTSMPACLDACAGMSELGVVNSDQGNTVQCRITFLATPAFEQPQDFCSAASLDSVGPCTGSVTQPCVEYCDTYVAACDESSFAFSDSTDCLNYCKNVGSWPEGDELSSGNTVSCRLGQAQQALDQSGNEGLESCRAAGPTGNGVCGSHCDNYCNYVLQHCVQNNLLYADESTCLEFCAVFPDVGAFDDLTGDSLQCRLNHAVQAHLNPVESCSAASFLGGSVCVAP